MMELINKDYKEVISNWLLVAIILVFLMIIVGGLTRLTDSGLSITEWELFQGIFPPLSNDTWNIYFELYKQIPQYKILNPNMTMGEFKVIFYWEYFHRLLGRIIGLFYIIPLIYFSFKKVLDTKSLLFLYVIFLLILFQGFLGWYMVESGLIENVSVSHFRLSIHLFFAFLIISSLIWSYLNISSNKIKKFFNFKNKLILVLFFLLLLQIIVGAFVSGLDAGLIYQTWPKMNLTYFPDDLKTENLTIKYLFNDQSFIQFLHRCIAYIIILFVIFLGARMYLFNKYKYRNYFIFMLLALFTQAVLGIFTLISGLNLYLASLHQITSVILIYTVLNFYHKLS